MSWHFRSSDTIADTIVSVLQALFATCTRHFAVWFFDTTMSEFQTPPIMFIFYTRSCQDSQHSQLHISSITVSVFWTVFCPVYRQ